MWYTAATFIFFFILTSGLGFYLTIRPTKYLSDYTPREYGLDYEKITFKTTDGLNLHGWFIPSEKTDAKTMILLHGYPADKGNVLPGMIFLHKTYNLFLFDFRYHGESDGNYTTVGGKEIRDLKAAILYLKTRNINEVGIWGFSMGGAVALMAAPDIPEIKVIISDSSYSQLSKMADNLYRLPVLKTPLGWLTLFWAKLFLGLNPDNVSPADAAARLGLPILIIHSKNDEIITFDQAEEIQSALKNNQQAEFWFSNNYLHGQSDYEYQKNIADFLNKYY